MAETTTKPKPSIDADIAPFWAGVERREFLLFRCRECGAWYWPAAYCRNHDAGPFAEKMRWEPASGLGAVFVFNVHHWAFDAAFKEDVPYVYALIELDEGPMFGTNIVGTEPSRVKVGDRVRIVFKEREDGVVLPLAELA